MTKNTKQDIQTRTANVFIIQQLGLLE